MYTLSDLPPTFRLVAINFSDILQKKSNVVFFTDMHLPFLIKSSESKCRGCFKKLLLKGLNTRTSADFKDLLTNGDNKAQKLCGPTKTWQID